MTKQILSYNYVGVAWAKITQMYAIICAHESENQAKPNKNLAEIQRACYMLTESCFPKMLADGGKPIYDKDGQIKAVDYRGFKFRPLYDSIADAEYFEYVRGYLHANTTEFMTYRDLSDTYKVEGYNLSFPNALKLMDDFSKHGYSADFCGYDASISSHLPSILRIRDSEKITAERFKRMTDKERALCMNAIIRSLPVGVVENYVPFDLCDLKNYIQDKESHYICKEELCAPNIADNMIRFIFPDETEQSLSTICKKNMQLYASVDGLIYFLPAVVKDDIDFSDHDAIIANTKTYTDLKVSIDTKEFTANFPVRSYTEAERFPWGAGSEYYGRDYYRNRLPETEYAYEDFFLGDVDLPLEQLAQFKGIMQYIPNEINLHPLTEESQMEQDDPMARW